MKIKRTPSPFTKKARRGFRGFPIATIAFYGPDDTRASKVAVGIVLEDGAEPEHMEKWYSDNEDLRFYEPILREVAQFLKEHNVLSVASVDRIIGCPHEEVIDYPEGTSCPQCPFWEGRNRWTGKKDGESKMIH